MTCLSRRSLLGFLAAGPIGTALGQSAFTLVPAPPPSLRVPGMLRVSGPRALEGLLERWRDGFVARYPSVRMDVTLRGSDVGFAALYTGRADLTLSGRPCSAAEEKAFEWIHRYRMSAVEVATGSLDRPGCAPAPVFFVHPQNPLSHLTIEQVAAIFLPVGAAAGAPIRTWGDLGLRATWARQPIRIYAFDMDSGTGRFFRAAVLGDSRRLEWTRFREFPVRITEPDEAAVRRIFRELRRDRFGLALAHHLPGESARAVALWPADAPGPVLATTNSLVARRYPLTRCVKAYFNRQPGRVLPPEVSAFLDYARSADGQAVIVEEGDYLPLPKTENQS